MFFICYANERIVSNNNGHLHACEWFMCQIIKKQQQKIQMKTCASIEVFAPKLKRENKTFCLIITTTTTMTKLFPHKISVPAGVTFRLQHSFFQAQAKKNYIYNANNMKIFFTMWIKSYLKILDTRLPFKNDE